MNDEICHGFPRNEPLKEGDIVTIDFVVNLRGALADSAWTYAIGDVSEDVEKLLDVTEQSLYKGIEQAVLAIGSATSATPFKRTSKRTAFPSYAISPDTASARRFTKNRMSLTSVKKEKGCV
ncbi:Methionine aminopeptidase 1 [Geobacillus sp. BCO2]|nr:Methionine aminopeptidase 1 [Geobacillus sp. BCO2]